MEFLFRRELSPLGSIAPTPDSSVFGSRPASPSDSSDLSGYESFDSSSESCFTSPLTTPLPTYGDSVELDLGSPATPVMINPVPVFSRWSGNDFSIASRVSFFKARFSATSHNLPGLKMLMRGGNQPTDRCHTAPIGDIVVESDDEDQCFYSAPASLNRLSDFGYSQILSVSGGSSLEDCEVEDRMPDRVAHAQPLSSSCSTSLYGLKTPPKWSAGSTPEIGRKKTASQRKTRVRASPVPSTSSTSLGSEDELRVRDNARRSWVADKPARAKRRATVLENDIRRLARVSRELPPAPAVRHSDSSLLVSTDAESCPTPQRPDSMLPSSTRYLNCPSASELSGSTHHRKLRSEDGSSAAKSMESGASLAKQTAKRKPAKTGQTAKKDALEPYAKSEGKIVQPELQKKRSILPIYPKTTIESKLKFEQTKKMYEEPQKVSTKPSALERRRLYDAQRRQQQKQQSGVPKLPALPRPGIAGSTTDATRATRREQTTAKSAGTRRVAAERATASAVTRAAAVPPKQPRTSIKKEERRTSAPGEHHHPSRLFSLLVF